MSINLTGGTLCYEQEVHNEIMVNAELAKRSVWVVKNYDTSSEHKCKNTATETKKRLEQLSKQLKVSKK